MKDKLIDAKCINCNYYEKYKRMCKKHKMKTQPTSICLTGFERRYEENEKM